MSVGTFSGFGGESFDRGRGNVLYSQPYLVLDLGQFTARCRWCLWQSAPCGALDEAQLAYRLHTCLAGRVAASAEFSEWRPR